MFADVWARAWRVRDTIGQQCCGTRRNSAEVDQIWANSTKFGSTSTHFVRLRGHFGASEKKHKMPAKVGHRPDLGGIRPRLGSRRPTSGGSQQTCGPKPLLSSSTVGRSSALGSCMANMSRSPRSFDRMQFEAIRRQPERAPLLRFRTASQALEVCVCRNRHKFGQSVAFSIGTAQK